MDKYGIHEDSELKKEASSLTDSCPKCPKCGKLLDEYGTILICSDCGTEPFEKVESKKEKENTK